MKKFKESILMLILIAVSFICFSANVKAADTVPGTIQTGSVTTLNQYVPGVTAYYKPISGGNFVYCEAAGLKYSTGVTMKLVGPVADGFVYIMNNKPNTGDVYKNYYIVQVATWYYKDIINGNDNNIPVASKNYIIGHRNDNAVCKAIYNLVEGARSYKQTTGSVSFSTNTVTWSIIGNYYVSDAITITSKNVTLSKLEFVNAPTGTTLYSDNTKNGNGTFQIKVPVSSVTDGTTVNFSIKIAGTYKYGKVYEYYYSAAYQKVILDQVYNTSYDTSASKNVSLTKALKKSNQLAITKVDEKGKYVSGATLTLYNGDCVSSTCTSVVSSWKTDANAKLFVDIALGKYTLVETATPDGYKTASKMLINIDSNDKTYTYTMVDYHKSEVRISKTDITGEKELPGATLVLKTSTGKQIATWVSTDKPKYFTLDEGEYTLTETIAPAGYKKSSTTITFKVDNIGNVYEKNGSNYTKVDYIKMVNDVKSVTNFNKLNSDTNEYVSGAVLVIKNLKGETVAKWTTTNESYYLSLDAGEYILTEESAPEGYVLNPEAIYFKINDDGNLMVKNEQNEYIEANGVIMYDMPEGEVVEVPKTGLSSTLTYVIGISILSIGAIVLLKNEKQI